jgi:hypothetical protein
MLTAVQFLAGVATILLSFFPMPPSNIFAKRGPDQCNGATAITAGTEPDEGSVDFLVPKGAGRFHFVGGARFVHGSAMPQEIVVPVIVVKEGDAEKTRTKPVDVSQLGSSNRIVTNKQRFEFIQTEAVSDRAGRPFAIERVALL